MRRCAGLLDRRRCRPNAWENTKSRAPRLSSKQHACGHFRERAKDCPPAPQRDRCFWPRWRHRGPDERGDRERFRSSREGHCKAVGGRPSPRQAQLCKDTLPRTALRGFKAASVQDAKARCATPPALLTLRLRFKPTPAPGNHGRRNRPPVGKTERRRGGSGTAHKGTGCSRGQFHRSPRPRNLGLRRHRHPAGPVGPRISPHVSFAFAAGSGFPCRANAPRPGLSLAWEPPLGLTAVARQTLLPRETECASTRR